VSNSRKTDKLGMSFSTASARLRKLVMFNLAQRAGLDVCFRCGERIEDSTKFSIEHKEPWSKSSNPKEKFFDLENIAFSHTTCNYIANAAILSEEDVQQVRQLLSAGWSARSLGIEFGVSHKTILKIKHGKSWNPV